MNGASVTAMSCRLRRTGAQMTRNSAFSVAGTAVAAWQVMTIVRAGLVAMMVLTSLACDSSLDNHTGGTGTDAGAEVRAAPVPPPRCLLDLIATCPLAGACQYSGSDDGDQRFCLASGETVAVARTGLSSPNVLVTEVRRSDGTLCYSIEKSCGTFCESYNYAWKDAAGALVARGWEDVLSENHMIGATCEATGETCIGYTATITDPRESCVTRAVTSPAAGLGCTQGSCP